MIKIVESDMIDQDAQNVLGSLLPSNKFKKICNKSR